MLSFIWAFISNLWAEDKGPKLVAVVVCVLIVLAFYLVGISHCKESAKVKKISNQIEVEKAEQKTKDDRAVKANEDYLKNLKQKNEKYKEEVKKGIKEIQKTDRQKQNKIKEHYNQLDMLVK